MMGHYKTGEHCRGLPHHSIWGIAPQYAPEFSLIQFPPSQEELKYLLQSQTKIGEERQQNEREYKKNIKFKSYAAHSKMNRLKLDKKYVKKKRSKVEVHSCFSGDKYNISYEDFTIR